MATTIDEITIDYSEESGQQIIKQLDKVVLSKGMDHHHVSFRRMGSKKSEMERSKSENRSFPEKKWRLPIPIQIQIHLRQTGRTDHRGLPKLDSVRTVHRNPSGRTKSRRRKLNPPTSTGNSPPQPPPLLPEIPRHAMDEIERILRWLPKGNPCSTATSLHGKLAITSSPF